MKQGHRPCRREMSAPATRVTLTTMARADHTEHGAAGADEVEKDITVEAYLAPKRAGPLNERGFCSLIDPDRDYHAEDVTKTTEHYVVFEQTGRRVSVSEREFKDISSDIATGELDGDLVSVEKETSRSTTKRHYTFNAADRFIKNHLLSELPENVVGLTPQADNGRLLDAETGEVVVDFNASQGYTKVLAHHDRRTESNRYEEDDDGIVSTHAVTLTCSVEDRPDRVERISDELVAALYDAFQAQEWVWKVRTAECKITREGDCFV